MYDTLRPEKLTATSVQIQRMQQDPTQVVNLEMFSENQFPYLEVRRPFILGMYWFCMILFSMKQISFIKILLYY